ncbi:MAG: polymerase sigma-70 factor, subfamily [Frankiaceae bacterium]|jgi:RNA polymerase sigma-70 factor (ECF subfamily)|nr:polymerase sigma-70 factor, subfamily [Frankiaceae bacterium]
MDIDPEVVRACQRGEAGALDALVRATYADVYALAYRLVRDRDEAADVTQEVFVRVMRSVVGFRGESAFGTWLHRVTVNTALTALRKRSRRAVPGREAFGMPDSVHDVVDPDAGPEERAERAELLARAEAAVAALPESSRTIVVLRDVEGLSTAEVAAQTGLSETAVKVRLFRARERLRASLSDDSVTPLPRRTRRGTA